MEHPADLVERVAAALVGAAGSAQPERQWPALAPDARGPWLGMARYALDLATRAAREGSLEAWDSRGDDPPGFWALADFPAEEAQQAVFRAVEGA